MDESKIMKKRKYLNKSFKYLIPVKNKKLIRCGSKCDGGYVVDKNVANNCKNLVSLGVGDNWSFEYEFIKKNKNIKIYAYDYSLRHFDYLKNILKYFRRFITFRSSYNSLKIVLDNYRNFRNFINCKNINFYKEKITYPVRNKSENDIHGVFSRINIDEDVAFKIDIEGSEYNIINQIKKYSNKIELLVIEFHQIDKKKKKFEKYIKELNKKFSIIHLHGNNFTSTTNDFLPITLEITFLNKKYIVQKKNRKVYNFPIKGLDSPNNFAERDLNFSFKKK